jgi:hypothetical protein
MIHDRPYKRAISHEAAVNELRRHAGTQFDPELVTLFCDLYASRAPSVEPLAEPSGNPAIVTFGGGTAASEPRPAKRRGRRASTQGRVVDDTGNGASVAG